MERCDNRPGLKRNDRCPIHGGRCQCAKSVDVIERRRRDRRRNECAAVASTAVASPAVAAGLAIPLGTRGCLWMHGSSAQNLQAALLRVVGGCFGRTHACLERQTRLFEQSAEYGHRFDYAGCCLLPSRRVRERRARRLRPRLRFRWLRCTQVRRGVFLTTPDSGELPLPSRLRGSSFLLFSTGSS